jgi:hypothetical protein
MNDAFEVQLRQSVATVDHRRPPVAPFTGVINTIVLALAFFSMAIGYALNTIRPEVVIELVNRTMAQ